MLSACVGLGAEALVLVGELLIELVSCEVVTELKEVESDEMEVVVAELFVPLNNGTKVVVTL